MIASETILTKEILKQAAAPNGTYTQEQKDMLGVSGPKKKWARRVVGQAFPDSVLRELVALRSKNIATPTFYESRGGEVTTFSPEQVRAIRAVKEWIDHSDEQVFYLAGYAGTGKSTMAKHIASHVGNVVFAAFTGKAALVLRNKGCHGASTIHSLIYVAEYNQDTDEIDFVWNPMSPARLANLIVIDECSMVGEELATHLLDYGKKVLVLGDPAQLPPVKDTGYFTNREPDFMLTDIHRQAEGNPIIHLSKQVRMGNKLSLGTYGESRIVPKKTVSDEDLDQAGQVLVGMNKTRRMMNESIREMRGYHGKGFKEGEKLVCLRNDKELGLMNGSIWYAEDIHSKNWCSQKMSVISEDGDNIVDVNAHYAWMMGREDELSWREQMQYQAFDYGYTLSVHKSQGSQWSDVLVYDESSVFRDDARKHLYTAITRASDRVTIAI